MTKLQDEFQALAAEDPQSADQFKTYGARFRQVCDTALKIPDTIDESILGVIDDIIKKGFIKVQWRNSASVPAAGVCETGLNFLAKVCEQPEKIPLLTAILSPFDQYIDEEIAEQTMPDASVRDGKICLATPEQVWVQNRIDVILAKMKKTALPAPV